MIKIPWTYLDPDMLCCIVGAAAAAITGAVNIKNMGHRPLCKRGTRPQQIYL